MSRKWIFSVGCAADMVTSENCDGRAGIGQGISGRRDHGDDEAVTRQAGEAAGVWRSLELARVGLEFGGRFKFGSDTVELQEANGELVQQIVCGITS